jgi:hypothetical protein
MYVRKKRCFIVKIKAMVIINADDNVIRFQVAIIKENTIVRGT